MHRHANVMTEERETIFELHANADNFEKTIEEAVNLYRLFKTPDFEQWFEQWEQGFPTATQERGLGNFKVEAWRSDASKRPRFREWTSKEQRTQLGYRAIEYWRDRSVENESVALVGTDAQLINHIIQLEYEGGGAAVNKGKGGSLPYMKGQPLITLYFVQDADRVTAGKTPVRGEISFRIMDKSDDPKSPLDRISKSDLTTYATRIKEQFATPSLYEWDKGKDVVSYRNRRQGFESWYAVKNLTAGVALITRLLAITNQQIDMTCVFHSENADPGNAYPDNPPPIMVLGETIPQPSERPLAEVRFQSAEISLAKQRGKVIQLVFGSEIVYKP